MLSRAQELGQSVVAFTDHETISSWVKIEKAAAKCEGLKVIRGNEIYLCRNGLNAQNFDREKDKYYHFILLAKDLIGAHQIFELSTRAWLRSYMARGMRRVPTYYSDLWDIIAKNPGHVIGSTACLGGALPTQILKETSDEKLGLWTEQMIQIFGKENFFYELQPSKNPEQIKVNKWLVSHCDDFGIEYIITTDSHYLKKEDRPIHKAFLNAQNGDREVDDFYATTYLMGTEEIESYFSYLSREELDRAYKVIETIKDSCEDFSILKPLKIPQLLWRPVDGHLSASEVEEYTKKIPMLETFFTSPHKSDNYLARKVIDGIRSHSDLQNQEAYDELNENLERTWKSSEVNKAQWSAYFLNLQRNIDECWNAGTIVGPSRGSGGGFLLLYCLDIIQMNKLRENAPMTSWRFLNPARVSVLDIDTDIEGGRRNQVLQHFRKVYSEDRVANVTTFRTEKSKSAVQTAARGLGIDVDIAAYIASLIPADRGQLRSLDQCMYGDEENGWKPIKQFVIEMTENYPELWQVAHGIEGLINGSGIHAGGVIFVDEPFTESTALMRAPDGTICTQFELHDCEDVSLIKIDLLSVEAMDKIHICIDLLCKYGYAERKSTLRETYESIIGIYNLERDAEEMWDMVQNHKIGSLFQMEKQSGIQGIAIAHPRKVEELAVLNSVIRLMASEKGAEQPLDMWARYRNNIEEWYSEMRQYGLTEEQIQWLANNPAINDGICESQEGLMTLVQDARVGGNDLNFADKCRKAIAKKQGKLFEECEQHYFENAKEKGCDMTLAHYIWDVLFKVQRGYSFNLSHTYAYSLIALQEMNLAYRYPIIFWNCACLINDAGGDEKEKDEDVYDGAIECSDGADRAEDYGDGKAVSRMESDLFSDEDDDDDDGAEDEGDGTKASSQRDKKEVKKVNYGKVATAIGKMKAAGIKVVEPSINDSEYTFTPNVEKQLILHGLSGITRVSEDLIQTIIKNRPYTSFGDFLKKVKVNKLQAINLIKSGIFDEFDSREKIMREYIGEVCGAKKRLTLQNANMLIQQGLIPDELDFEKRVYNFNKYLKNLKKDDYFSFDDIAYRFFEKNFSLDELVIDSECESGFKIFQAKWKKIYDKHMGKIRSYIKENHDELLEKLNNNLMGDLWNKYSQGSISKWEMDSMSCYVHDHELSEVDFDKYGLSDFQDLSSTPQIEKVIPIKGKQVPLFKLYRICGTVLDRDKAKKTVSLLTTSGVVTVKIYGGVFEQYDRQLSQKGADGKKHVIQKSLFSRGNKIIVTGIRQEDGFLAKTYSRTPWHKVELITEINGKDIKIQHERPQVDM